MNKHNSSKAAERKTTEGHSTECQREPRRILDEHGTSATVQCMECRKYLLLVDRPENEKAIPLADFHLKRGNDPDQRPFNDRTMATRLVRCLNEDTWPTPATVMDFGIESDAHLGALQHAVRCGRTDYDLDRVMGDGPAITQLVRSVPDQPFKRVEFRTPYDNPADVILEDE